MADLDTKDFNLTNDLKPTDRITLTDSETGHQFASMEVATFLEQLTKKLPTATLQENGLMSSADNQRLNSLKRTANYAGAGKYVLLLKLFAYHFNQATILAVVGSPGIGPIGLDVLSLKNPGIAIAVALNNNTSYHQGYFCRETNGATELWVKIHSDIQIDIVPIGGNGYELPLTLSDTEPSGLISVEIQKR